ncbi:hypothetical protein ES703_92037 [subsurface metagenome]|jgi:hypothetical protein
MPVEEDFKYFKVESKGYKKQFTSQVQARRTFSGIEKKAVKDEETVSVKLFGKQNIEDEWIILDEVEIADEYYES